MMRVMRVLVVWWWFGGGSSSSSSSNLQWSLSKDQAEGATRELCGVGDAKRPMSSRQLPGVFDAVVGRDPVLLVPFCCCAVLCCQSYALAYPCTHTSRCPHTTTIQPHHPLTQQVGVFDTAFHQTMPDTAFMYGLPYDWYTQHAIRRYGFHGTRCVY